MSTDPTPEDVIRRGPESPLPSDQCSHCGGTGSSLEWDIGSRRALSRCPVCGGTGHRPCPAPTIHEALLARAEAAEAELARLRVANLGSTHFHQWCDFVWKALAADNCPQPSEQLLATLYGTYCAPEEAVRRVKERTGTG